MNESTPPPKRYRRPLERPGLVSWPPGEVKVQWLGERPEQDPLCDTPDRAVSYWNSCVALAPWYRPEAECLVALMLTSRRGVRCHSLIAMGTLDTILAHPREVFRGAIMTSAAAIIMMHNHPSGDPTPSEADIKVTRDMHRAGQLLKIELLDHVIVGTTTPERPRGHVSLRELGYFYT